MRLLDRIGRVGLFDEKTSDGISALTDNGFKLIDVGINVEKYIADFKIIWKIIYHCKILRVNYLLQFIVTDCDILYFFTIYIFVIPTKSRL